jgi:hypothetical protein
MTFLGMILGLSAAPAPGAEARVPLTATTTIQGSVGGFVSVSVPRTVRVPARRDRVGELGRIRSDSRIAGVVLRGEASADLDPYKDDVPPLLAFWRAQPQVGESVFGTNPADDGSIELLVPAGDYRLYLLTDGSPAQVTLSLPGLPAGAQTLSPDFSTPSSLSDPPLVRETATPHSWIFGSERTATSAGFFTTQLYTESKPGYADSELCFYEGKSESEDPFGSGCSDTSPGSVYTEDGWRLQSHTSVLIPRGTYGIGAQVTRAEFGDEAPTPDVRAALLSFDPPSPITVTRPTTQPSPQPTPSGSRPASRIRAFPRAARVGTKTSTGLRVSFTCKAVTTCEASARVNRGPSRVIKVGPKRTIRASFIARVRGSKASLTLESADGKRVRRTSVRIKRPR